MNTQLELEACEVAEEPEMGVADDGAASLFGFESGRGSAYEYLPEWMTIPGLYETEDREDAYAVLKYFTPDAGWTWYVVEVSEDEDLCFGLVAGLCTELGYFSLAEIKDVRGPWGLKIERDLYFKPTAVKELAEYKREWPQGGPYEALEGSDGDASGDHRAD